jgi:PAS domain S-box-containing protein
MTTSHNPGGIDPAGQSNGYPEKAMTEIIPNGFFVVNHEWIVKEWNKTAEDLLAVKADHIVGRNLWEAFAGVIPVEFYRVYHDAILQDIPVHFVEYWEEMGAWFDVITYYHHGSLSVSFKCSTQPAHQELLEERLKNLNELYRCVTEVTNDCLWEWDLFTNELFWIDGGHKRVFGYPIVNAIVPQPFWENRLHPDDKLRILTKLRETLAIGTVAIWEDEYRFRKADGTYAYVQDRAHIIYGKDGKASRMIGATIDITARKIAEMQLVESERQLGQERLGMQKELTQAILNAQERERADIGKELHDNLNQILGATKMYVELAKTDEENRQLCLDKASNYLLIVIEAIRKISKSLTFPEQRLMGLTESINILLDDLMIIQPIKIEFSENGIDEKRLSEKLRLDILRIVQEQLNNILKHAKASFAKVNLTQEPSQIVLQIVDDGDGCKIVQNGKGMGIGMINIRSRAESHNGRVTIASNPGKGFDLKVELPLNSRDRQEVGII